MKDSTRKTGTVVDIDLATYSLNVCDKSIQSQNNDDYIPGNNYSVTSKEIFLLVFLDLKSHFV